MAQVMENSTVTPEEVHQILVTEAEKLGWPESYADDLYVHDRKILVNNPEIIERGFVWLISASSTHIISTHNQSPERFEGTTRYTQYRIYLYNSEGGLKEVSKERALEFLKEYEEQPEPTQTKRIDVRIPQLKQLMGSLPYEVRKWTTTDPKLMQFSRMGRLYEHSLHMLERFEEEQDTDTYSKRDMVNIMRYHLSDVRPVSLWDLVAYYYQEEVDSLMSYAQNAEQPLVSMGLFYKDGNSWVCNFSVNDMAIPVGNSYNFHGQNTSQWKYAGSLRIREIEEDGVKTYEVSTHH